MVAETTIEIGKDAIVYVVCPPAYASGGPELMYQLTSKLESYGLKAFMYYHPKHENPIHSNYKVYGTRSVDIIEDEEKNLIVVPEALVPSFNRSHNFTRIRKCIWWLSVDNFFTELYRRAAPRRIARYPVIRDLKIYENRFFSSEVIQKNYRYHLAQSYYAMQFLRRKKISPGYLSDYLNATFFKHVERLPAVKKEDLVLYNPEKGYKFTRKIMEQSPELTWMPIEKMNPREVADLLARAKVYIDFGNHPGKDRFPREAALLNCCIITGKRGSAYYDEDLNIPKKYKIQDSKFNISKVIRLVKACLKDFEEHSRAFDEYRDIIHQEERNFVCDIKRVFLKTEN